MVPPDSRAILIGVSRYDDTESFPELQAAANSLRAMRAMLADPELCGWRPEQITTVPNPRSRAEVEELISDAAERTTGVLLIYYVGHGLLSPRSELCLTVASTRPARPKITGVPWDSVAEILDVRNCPAQTRIAILDCCYAGQVISESLSSSAAVADTVAVEGVYTLTATIRNRTAHVVPADQQDLACTSFTGELCDLVREGIAGRSKWLTLGELYPVLRDRLRSKGLPLPNQKGTDTADRFPFSVNRALCAPAAAKRPAGRAVAAPASPTVLPAEDTALLRQTAFTCFDAIVSYAYGARDFGGVLTQSRLSDLAEHAAIADPDRSERIARRLPDQDRRMQALAGIALIMATWATSQGRADSARGADLLERASRIAEELIGVLESTPLWKLYSQEGPQTSRLGRLMQGLAESDRWVGRVRLVQALAATDSSQASRYFDQALRASSLFDKDGRSGTRSDVAKAMVTINPDRAFDIAKSIDDKTVRSSAFREMAQIVAKGDRDQAARMLAEAELAAGKVRDKLLRAAWSSQVAEALAPLDAVWAERVANSVDHPGLGPAGRYAVASMVARTDPVRAERIGRGLPYDADKASILAIVARFFADPDRTAALLTEAEQYLRPLEPDARKAAATTEIARTLSAFDPGRATALLDEVETMIGNLVDTTYSHLLMRIVSTTAEIDPDRAAHILKDSCDMALSPESHVVNEAGRGITLLSFAKQCMKIISS